MTEPFLLDTLMSNARRLSKLLTAVAQSPPGVRIAMKSLPKYSLSFLFLEIFLFAVAFALLRTFTGPAELTRTRAIIIIAMSVCFCTGLGGLFQRMKWGAIGGVSLAVAFMWFMLEP